MSEATLEQERAVAARGDWQRAFDLLETADEARALSGEELALLASVAYAAGHLDVTIQAWECAYAQSLRAGDRRAAAGAATRVALHLLIDTALLAPVRGWIGRAEWLLEGEDPTPAHAWLAVVRNYERMFSGDFGEARQGAREAIEVGARCDPDAEMAPGYAPAPAERPGSFHREGEYWSVIFGGRTVCLRDAKGLRYLARLLAEPHRQFHVLDLVAAERGSTPDATPDTEPYSAPASTGGMGPILDARAKDAYRRRLSEIADDVASARAAGDVDREERADAERDLLVRELARALGLGGRDRPTGLASERARASVTRALRFALARISEHHPRLGEHLNHSIRTGTYCAYLPDPTTPVKWTQ